MEQDNHVERYLGEGSKEGVSATLVACHPEKIDVIAGLGGVPRIP